MSRFAARRERVTVLGATGSIGASTADVLARHPDRYEVFALTANRDVATLVERCRLLKPRVAVVCDASQLDALAAGLREAGLATRPLAGERALAEVAADDDTDTVVAAIVGAAGLDSTLAAARAGKRILLANKEAIVMAGDLLHAALAASGGELLPVDSEHSALLQCLPTGYRRGSDAGVEKLILTASGGPFRNRSRASLESVTPDEACAHPKWKMGRKISVDSATLMNKGLEVIEAHWLFGVPSDRIEVLVHPQSIVHSFVTYRDGSVLAQLGNPDMRTAIACALAWPGRIDAGVDPLDLVRAGPLEFEAPDYESFPCLALAYRSLQAGGAAPAVLNAANEVAVDAFLEGRLGFLKIADVVDDTLQHAGSATAGSLESLKEVDAGARAAARRAVDRMGKGR